MKPKLKTSVEEFGKLHGKFNSLAIEKTQKLKNLKHYHN